MKNLSELEALAPIIVKGILADMPEDYRNRVNECADKIRALVAEYGEQGALAVAFVAAETPL